MTKEEAIANLNMISVAFVEPVTEEQRKLIDDTFDMAIEALEKEPCEDEYIKVPKKALKYRTAGMVAYNAEWLKNHFDIERAVICGTQEPCEDAISRQAALDAMCDKCPVCNCFSKDCQSYKAIDTLPSVNPQPKTGHCKDCKWQKDKDGVYRRGIGAESKCPINRREVMEGIGYCFMYEPQERSHKE